MREPRKIAEDVFQVGGPDLTDSADCMVYLVGGEPAVLIDAGAGLSAPRIASMIEKAGVDVEDLRVLFLTHGHVDHIGGGAFFRKHCPRLKIVAHEGDAEVIRTADPVRTAADWYGVRLPSLGIDELFTGEGSEIEAVPAPITLLHTPGHTPGSCVAVTERDGLRILFGQDIHGPFLPEFDSDLDRWKASMEKLIELEADILCEGHYGIFEGKKAVCRFIERHLRLQGF